MKHLKTGYLVVLLLAVLMTTGGTFALYRTSGTSADGARVAKFAVELETGTTSAVAFDGSTFGAASRQTQTCSFTVKSGSEVAVGYTIDVKFSQPLPKTMTVAVDNLAPQQGDGSQTTFTFPGGSFAPGTQEQTHTLSLAAEYLNGAEGNVVTYNMQNNEVRIAVRMEQID